MSHADAHQPGPLSIVELRKRVGYVRRRLILQAWLAALPWFLAAGLLVACVLLAIDKFIRLGVQQWCWPVAGAALGVVAATLWTFLRRAGELEAAIEIDRRFGLRERVSSACALDVTGLESPAGQALLRDASATLERLSLASQFRMRLGRWLWLPVVPAAAALAIAIWLNPPGVQNRAEAATVAAQKKQIERSAESLRKKLEERRQEARQQGLKSADDLFARLEEGTRQLADPQSADRKQALVKLNDLAKQLADRQDQLATGRKLAEQLQQLKSLGQGPAQQLAKALEQGDLARAARELRALAEKLKRGELDAAGKQQLAKQLEQLQKQLRQMADQQRKLEEQLREQIAQQRAAGRNAEADKLQQQLDKLEQTRQARSLEQMAQKLGDCAGCLARGEGKQAGEALDQVKADLDQLSSQLAENETLSQALDEIAEAKESMTCKHCGGEGCSQCQGQGNKIGDGLGRGRGKGLRPEDKTDTSSYDTRVRQKVGRGSATMTDLVTGPNARGRVEQQIRQEWSGVKGDEADPLTEQPLPDEYRQHAKKYFDALREGE